MGPVLGPLRQRCVARVDCQKALATSAELELRAAGGSANGADEAEEAEDAAGGGDDGGGGGVTTSNGTLVPQKLIDRAAAARARLAA